MQFHALPLGGAVDQQCSTSECVQPSDQLKAIFSSSCHVLY